MPFQDTLMTEFSLLPWARRVRVDILRELEDQILPEEGERLTDLLQSEPVRGRLSLVFCTHGRSLGTGVTGVTGRSHSRVISELSTAGISSLPSGLILRTHSPPFPYNLQTCFDSSWVAQVRTLSPQLHSIPGSDVSDDTLSTYFPPSK